MSEFERINRPRVEKIHKMLDTIEKSARSLKADPDELLETVRERLTGGEDVPGGNPPEVPKASPAIQKEGVALANLSTQQLVDRMIACGFELGTRRL